MAGGTSLQPVLYALAAEKLFGATAKVESGRLYFCTSAGGFTEHIVPLDACIETMRQTGADMDERYKETSLGGLSVALPEC